jgi:uncharacterized protein (TIGR03067 family)
MKSSSTFFFLRAVLALCLIVIWGIPEARAAAKTELEGTWVGKEHFEGHTVVFANDHMSFKSPNPQVWYEATFKCDPGADPKRMEIRIEETGLPDYNGLTSLAIYKIEDDTLTLAMNEPGNAEWPEEFSRAGGAIVLILNKEK